MSCKELDVYTVLAKYPVNVMRGENLGGSLRAEMSTVQIYRRRINSLPRAAELNAPN